MQIDIRDGMNDEVTAIVFHGPDCDGSDATTLKLSDSFTYIRNKGTDKVFIQDKKHAENLIKALQKAIELGNWSE